MMSRSTRKFPASGTTRHTVFRLVLWAVVLGGALPAAPALAGDIYVIANVQGLTLDDVRDIYTGERQLAGSVKLVPLDNAALQAEFLQKVLRMDGAKYGTLWTKKSFRDGLNAPAVKGSDLEIISFVKKTPGAIGYVAVAPVGMTVVQKY